MNRVLKPVAVKFYYNVPIHSYSVKIPLDDLIKKGSSQYKALEIYKKKILSYGFDYKEFEYFPHMFTFYSPFTFIGAIREIIKIIKLQISYMAKESDILEFLNTYENGLKTYWEDSYE